MEAWEIEKLLYEKYKEDGRYVCAREVSSSTGFSSNMRRFDFVVVNCWPSDGLKIEAFEIKVSKPDLRRELEHPEKHNWAFDDIDTYWLARPEEIVDMDLIPKKWGVMVVSDGKLVVKRKPVALHDDKEHHASINRKFAVSVIRAMAKAESRKALAELDVTNQRKEAYESGYRAGMKDVAQGDFSPEKIAWMWRFCQSLGAYTEKDAKVKEERYHELSSIGWRLEWLLDAANMVQDRAAGLKKLVADKINEAKLKGAVDDAHDQAVKSSCF